MIVKPPPETIIAVYARTNSEEETNDPAHEQLIRGLDYALSQHWKVAGGYADIGCDSTSFDGRLGYYSMMAAARRGEFSMILVEEMDRVHSDASVFRSVAEGVRDWGVTLYTVAACLNLEPIGTDLDAAFGNVIDFQSRRERASREFTE